MGSASISFHEKNLELHIHVQHANGEARFWLEPTIELALNYGLKPRQIHEVEKLIEEHLNEIRRAWDAHLSR